MKKLIATGALAAAILVPTGLATTAHATQSYIALSAPSQAKLGDNLNIKCKAPGTTPGTTIWITKDGQKMSGGTSERRVATDGSCDFNGLPALDAGMHSYKALTVNGDVSNPVFVQTVAP